MLFKPSEATTAAISCLLVDNLRCLARGACQEQKYSFELTYNKSVYLFVDDDVFFTEQTTTMTLGVSVIDDQRC